MKVGRHSRTLVVLFCLKRLKIKTQTEEQEEEKKERGGGAEKRERGGGRQRVSHRKTGTDCQNRSNQSISENRIS